MENQSVGRQTFSVSYNQSASSMEVGGTVEGGSELLWNTTKEEQREETVGGDTVAAAKEISLDAKVHLEL